MAPGLLWQGRHDFYSEKKVRVWLLFDPRDDLCLSRAEPGEEIGEPPDWYDYEIDGVGWNTILDIGWVKGKVRSEILWMLAEGIAPGQPFLVDLPKPRYYRCGEYGSETDVEYD